MLGMKSYSRDYIDGCRARIERDTKAFEALPAATRKAIESAFFKNLLLALEYSFVHRLIGAEGKDGNALSEVRILCNSILFNDCKLQVDKLPGWPMSAGSGMKLTPEKSVLKLKAGDSIELDGVAFAKLSKAFFAELEKRFT